MGLADTWPGNVSMLIMNKAITMLKTAKSDFRVLLNLSTIKSLLKITLIRVENKKCNLCSAVVNNGDTGGLIEKIYIGQSLARLAIVAAKSKFVLQEVISDRKTKMKYYNVIVICYDICYTCILVEEVAILSVIFKK